MTAAENIKCPSCGSEDISRPVSSLRTIAITILLLGFPLPFIGKKYHCFNCGFDFNRKTKVKKDEAEK
jgi:predicted RNA-binding Zn-ribbon protein involved in translation (DUF1610 family)